MSNVGSQICWTSLAFCRGLHIRQWSLEGLLLIFSSFLGMYEYSGY